MSSAKLQIFTRASGDCLVSISQRLWLSGELPWGRSEPGEFGLRARFFCVHFTNLLDGTSACTDAILDLKNGGKCSFAAQSVWCRVGIFKVTVDAAFGGASGSGQVTDTMYCKAAKCFAEAQATDNMWHFIAAKCFEETQVTDIMWHFNAAKCFEEAQVTDITWPCKKKRGRLKTCGIVERRTATERLAARKDL